jgi:hypothetical protein
MNLDLLHERVECRDKIAIKEPISESAEVGLSEADAEGS